MSALPYLYPCLMSHAPVSLLVVMLGTNDTKERLAPTPAPSARPGAACAEGTVHRLLGGRAAQPSDCRPARHRKGSGAISCGPGDGTGRVEKSLRLPGQFRAVAAETRCHFLDANALGLAHNPIDFMHLTRESHARLAAALAERIPTLF